MTASPLVFGWLEWAVLPELGIPAIRAKVDSGAKTSCLHADDIEEFEREGAPWVRFVTRPVRRRPNIAVRCEAPLQAKRSVISSNGLAEERCVIRTKLKIGVRIWRTEFTLTNRDTMRFRMLLGRSATAGRALVDPGESFLQKRLSYSVYRKIGLAE